MPEFQEKVVSYLTPAPRFDKLTEHTMLSEYLEAGWVVKSISTTDAQGALRVTAVIRKSEISGGGIDSSG